MVDIWIVISYILLVIMYSFTGYYLYNIMKGHFSNDSRFDTGRVGIKRAIKTFGLFPIAYLIQWHAYGLYKTHLIPNTFEMVLWVVITANLGGLFNLLLYYPLLLNQVKTENSKNKQLQMEKYRISNNNSNKKGRSRNTQTPQTRTPQTCESPRTSIKTMTTPNYNQPMSFKSITPNFVNNTSNISITNINSNNNINIDCDFKEIEIVDNECNEHSSESKNSNKQSRISTSFVNNNINININNNNNSNIIHFGTHLNADSLERTGIPPTIKSPLSQQSLRSVASTSPSPRTPITPQVLWSNTPDTPGSPDSPDAPDSPRAGTPSSKGSNATNETNGSGDASGDGVTADNRNINDANFGNFRVNLDINRNNGDEDENVGVIHKTLSLSDIESK